MTTEPRAKTTQAHTIAEQESELHQKFFPIIAKVASVTAVLMFIFYFPQIIGNLNGAKGDWIQPFVAMVNCTIWTVYGLWRTKKDWPIVIANVPGVIFGGLAGITALI